MTYAQNLWTYFGLLAGIILLPGLDMAYVAANALSGGRRAGTAALAGVMTGGAAHTLVAALGVAFLLTQTPSIFGVLAILGGGYMIWLGATLIREAGAFSSTVPAAAGPAASGRIALRGLMTCLMNPKAYVFMAAVFPQFIRPEYGPIWRQALVIGVMTVLTQGVIYGGVVWATARGGKAIIARPGLLRALVIAVGLAFIAIGAWGALHMVPRLLPG